MLTATARPLPPFLPPRTTRLTLHSDSRKAAQPAQTTGAQKSAEPELGRVLDEILANAAAHPLVPPTPTPAITAASQPAASRAIEDGDERQHQMEQIAGSLEDVARLLRGRGLSAFFRNEPDPLNQRLLGVIADHLAAH